MEVRALTCNSLHKYAYLFLILSPFLISSRSGQRDNSTIRTTRRHFSPFQQEDMNHLKKIIKLHRAGLVSASTLLRKNTLAHPVRIWLSLSSQKRWDVQLLLASWHLTKIILTKEKKKKTEIKQSESENAVLDKSMSLHLAKVLLHQKG